MNCWEYQKCKDNLRQKCPAYTDRRGLDCWKVTGTMCKGIQQNTIQQKIAFCHTCNFYKQFANKF
jgi:methyl-accepting chemotaxis protein